MQVLTIQKIVLPGDERHKLYWQLFYRSPRLDADENGLCIPKYAFVDFATYLNGVPVNKWREYTGLDNLRLNLTVVGKLRIILTGYTLSPEMPVRTVYSTTSVETLKPEQISIDYPDELTEEFVAFEIAAETDGCLLSGFFSSQFEEDRVRPVNLCIATTTFKKEKYIYDNLKSIKRELLEGTDDIKTHLFINVIDNGRTLKKEEAESEYIRLFTNDNVGGSGGFARGMYEALHMSPKITHVLLMDDDVLILPESIRRTYVLNQIVKKEYREAFVSGAMLELDSMYTMHEDVGILKADKSFFHAKPIFEVDKLSEIMAANSYFPPHKNQYAGWWYCCIPRSVIEKNGLPLPLFIRGDDVEYGIRCNPAILTLSGISIWHLSFNGKYSAATNLYQEFRNIFIVKDSTRKIPEVDVYGRWKQECYRASLTFDYDGWELLLLAIEDYMKGPGFIAKPNGTEILERNKAFQEKLLPLEEAETPGFYLEELSEPDPAMSVLQRLKYYLSYNGQYGLCKKSADATGLMRYEWDHKPGRNQFKDSLFVVDSVNRRGCLRRKDLKRFRTLLKRQKRDCRIYQERHQMIEEAYIKAYPVLTGMDFWKRYLQL